MFSPVRSARPPLRCLSSAVRLLHTTAPRREAVKLEYEAYPAPSDKEARSAAQAIVLCHGLFGSKQNWRSLAKALAQQVALPVYALDLRNHGTSPHVDSMRYEDMALDVMRFFDDYRIRNAVLVGHSMGGKAVQSMALSKELPSDYLSHLISVDMSPARGALSSEFAQYIEAMGEIEESRCTSRQQADEILARTEPDQSIRQFLLTNLHRPASADHWTFRIPVQLIKKNLAQIGDFPYDDPQGLLADARPTSEWDGPTLFVKGAKSKYLNRKNKPICDAFFPHAQHVTLDSGHWVQAEKPLEFVQEVAKFVAPA